ncbi:hypothetical protein NC981_03700 [Leptolyngbya sp. DQ-M1]|uniref:hypothetical protein n=1 Tax=Leptolyngbya sp. DQ-M1 TaxID=2933920 RepID=UPI003298D992
MNTKRVADMTIDDLKAFVTQVVEEKLQPAPRDPRSLQEILESIDRHMRTPPPGSKSTLELLREDRDR